MRLFCVFPLILMTVSCKVFTKPNQHSRENTSSGLASMGSKKAPSDETIDRMLSDVELEKFGEFKIVRQESGDWFGQTYRRAILEVKVEISTVLCFAVDRIPGMTISKSGDNSQTVGLSYFTHHEPYIFPSERGCSPGGELRTVVLPIVLWTLESEGVARFTQYYVFKLSSGARKILRVSYQDNGFDAQLVE